MRYLIALLLVSSLSTSLSAQTLTADDVKTQMIADWTRAKDYTDKYLAAMPADKYSFKAVDSIRSFAQQMLHLASGTYFLTSMAAGKKAPAFLAGIETRPTAQTMDSVVATVNASYDYALDVVRNTDPATLGAKIGPANRQASKYAILLKAFEHQTHHRGQTTIYIRLLGIRPPGEQLF